MFDDIQAIKIVVIRLILNVALFCVLVYFGAKLIMRNICSNSEQKAERILDIIGVKSVRLSKYEHSVASQLIDPSTMKISWNDIAGLEDIIQEIKETVILPIQKRKLFLGSNLIQPPKGVLLHGPPGCGKTMIAKATAKEAGACFINVDVSALMNKWYGESEKLAAAVFTLAKKIQPCIIFIDEIDCFLRTRDTFNHEATAMMKAQFMILWDGLITDSDCQIVVMGATNRPQDIDGAILRRMPAKFHIGLPTLKQRCGVLKRMLENEDIAEDVNIEEIAWHTDGFSGSDLRELCRISALYKVREQLKNGTKMDDELHQNAQRPINMGDFLNTLDRMKDSKVHTSIQREFNSRVPSSFSKNVFLKT